MKFFKTYGAPLALMLASGAAYADGPNCAGVADASWALNDAAQSDISVAADPLEVMSLAPLGQTIVTAFTVSESGEYRLEAKGTMGGDTLIELFDLEGNSINLDDDSGGEMASRLELDLDPGQYCLETSSYNEGVLAATVRIGRAEHEALTAGVSDGGYDGELCPANTTEVVLTGDAEGRFESFTQIVTPADDHFVQLRVESPINVVFEANNSEADPTMAIYDDSDSLLEENDDSDGLNSMIDFADGLEAGVYCVMIDAISDVTLPITFSASYMNPAERDLRDIQSGSMVPPADGSYPVTDLGALTSTKVTPLSMDGNAQWVRFTAPKDMLVAVEAVGNDIDPAVELFDDLGRSIAYNDDGPDGSLDSLMYGELEAGLTYNLAVTTIDEDSGPLRLALRPYVPMSE